MPWLDSFTKLLDKSAKIVGGLALGCTIVRWLFVDKLSNDVPGLKDGLLVASVVLWSIFIVMVVVEVWSWGRRKFAEGHQHAASEMSKARRQEIVLSRLSSLERECVETLAYLVRQNQQEVFDARNHILEILCDRGLMVETVRASVWSRGYMVVDFVWDYLCQPENKVRLSEIQITNNPPWRTLY
jgi:hypothetical protein